MQCIIFKIFNKKKARNLEKTSSTYVIAIVLRGSEVSPLPLMNLPLISHDQGHWHFPSSESFPVLAEFSIFSSIAYLPDVPLLRSQENNNGVISLNLMLYPEQSDLSNEVTEYLPADVPSRLVLILSSTVILFMVEVCSVVTQKEAFSSNLYFTPDSHLRLEVNPPPPPKKN